MTVKLVNPNDEQVILLNYCLIKINELLQVVDLYDDSSDTVACKMNLKQSMHWLSSVISVGIKRETFAPVAPDVMPKDECVPLPDAGIAEGEINPNTPEVKE